MELGQYPASWSCNAIPDQLKARGINLVKLDWNVQPLSVS